MNFVNNTIGNKRIAKMILKSLQNGNRGGAIWLDCYNQRMYNETSPCIRTGIDFRCMDYLINVYEYNVDEK